jgi:hypothetical protein
MDYGYISRHSSLHDKIRKFQFPLEEIEKDYRIIRAMVALFPKDAPELAILAKNLVKLEAERNKYLKEAFDELNKKDEDKNEKVS